MKLGLYKVENSLGYDRTTFYNYYDNPRKIEEMLQPLLDKDEAAIINLEDVESIDEFAEEYNDEIYDGGWWAVTIRDYEKPKQTVWVFYADQVTDCNVLEPVVEVFATEEAAQKHLHEFVHGDEGEYEYAEKRGWTIEDDDPDRFCAFEEGYYAGNHTEAMIEKKEVK